MNDEAIPKLQAVPKVPTASSQVDSTVPSLSSSPPRPSAPAPLTRYEMDWYPRYGLEPHTDPEGQWVKWSEVEAILIAKDERIPQTEREYYNSLVRDAILAAVATLVALGRLEQAEELLRKVEKRQP